MKKLLSLLMLLFAYTGITYGQACGFDIVHARMMAKDSLYSKSIQAINARWAQKTAFGLAGLPTTTIRGKVYEIPVVIHVIHTGGAVGTTYNPSDATLTAMIDYLNASYQTTYASYPDTNNGGTYFPVKFVLAKRNPSCATTTGIVRVDGSSITNYSLKGINLSHTSGVDEATIKALSRWRNTEYYNIWIVNKIDSNDGTFGTFTAGYAYFPGAPYTIDGTVMLATQAVSGQITLPHEIGHAFNLYHTFEGDGTGSTCPTNTNCNTNGDQICDTEPHKRSPFNCPSDPNPCTSISYSNVQHNFMDYSNCQDRFTPGQRLRWLDGLLISRPGLASSLGGVATTASGTPVAASCVTTIASANSANTFGIGPVKVVLNDMTSNSGGYSADGFLPYIDRTCTQRATITQGQSYTLAVSTTTNTQKVNVFIDYNNDGSFSSGELVFANTGSTATQTHSTTYAVPTTGVTTCTPLRMRVVADFVTSTLPGTGCGTLDYGQAEDFTVYVKPASANITLTNAITTGSNPSCSGSPLTFTASPSATLTTPTYTWYVNGVQVNTGTTYSTSSITTGSWVQCKVTYTSSCGVDSAFSNIINVDRTGGAVVPSVTISANPGNTICAGTSVTFTAVPTNGGSTPSYQWKLNGGNVGTNSTTYTNAGLVNSDVVTCVMTSNASCASPTTGTSSGITMTVTPNVSPSVSIAANPGNTICAGTSVTFTASPTNGGTTPAYQWKLNGGNVGTNSNTYTNATLANSDVVSCVMTSNASCLLTASATSNLITMTVTAGVTPAVAISANPGNTICSGTSVTFTAAPTNGGTTPSYQWKLNGGNVGTNSTTYTNATLANSDVITCVMTSNAGCVTSATATSNAITMNVSGTIVPAVSISANPGSTICAGTSVTFTAVPANGGTTPSYQWKLNGGNVGTNSTTYTNTTLANGDIITCVMTSNLACASPASATSNGITMNTTGTLAPAVSIAANPGNTICSGTSVTFTATPTNGGTTPAYQWKLNGGNVGTNSTTYTNATLANGDVVTCVMTSSLGCASPTTGTSNSITMNVSTTLAPTVTISANPGNTICAGISVTFTAVPTNGGTTPAYQWKLNGGNVGTNSATYTNLSLANSDVVTCVLTSSSGCASPTTATSNTITMTVNPIVVPTISIAAAPGNTICAGTSVLFTATITNGGASPSYQWKLNGANVGTNSATYTNATLANGNGVTCVLTSNANCATPALVTSNAINMNVTPIAVPSVAVTATPGNTICAGTSVTFTAVPTNGGTTPAYQWKLNGVNVGTNSTTYTNAALANGNVVTCVMTSNANCATPSTATSNAVTMTVNPLVTPTVSISANPGAAICSGASVTFTATITNGGPTPIYQWKLNGVSVGTNSNTYTNASLANGNVVSCVLTSTASCLTATTATSNNITMTVSTPVTPAVSISANPGSTICSGRLVTFTATPVNGGTPSYQWKRNGINVGTNSTVYANAALANGDVITCVMTSSVACVTSATATSTGITMTVNPLTTPSVNLVLNTGNTTICTGGSVTFNATVTNGGTSQSYAWTKNSLPVGTNSNSFTTNSINSGDVIVCNLTITAQCPSPATVSSPPVTMNVVSQVVDITVLPNDTICSVTPAAFTAKVINGGNNPIFQWQLNGNNVVGAIAGSYTLTPANNVDIVTAVMVSSDNCIGAPVNGNTIVMRVKGSYNAAVSINAKPDTNVAPGTRVKFTASVGGPGTVYQWRMNDIDIPGAHNIDYETDSLVNNDVISLWIQTPDSCAIVDTASSNKLTMHVGLGIDHSKDIFDHVALSPNPNNGSFTITGKMGAASKETGYIEVINAVGAIVYRDTFTVSGVDFSKFVDLGERANNGLHMVRITVGERSQVLKFVTSR